MLMTEMAAVQQRTPTPVDSKQRTAFIESMEEEMRRVAEHLERRGTRRGVVAYSSSRPAFKSMEAVNGWSFTEGSGSEAGARRKRINKHPRTLSMPPEEDPPSGPRVPLSAPPTEISQAGESREGRGDSCPPDYSDDTPKQNLSKSFSMPQALGFAELAPDTLKDPTTTIRSPPPIPPKPKSRVKETVQCFKQIAPLENQAPLAATLMDIDTGLDANRDDLNITPTPIFSPPPAYTYTDGSREDLDTTPTPMSPPPPLPPPPPAHKPCTDRSTEEPAPPPIPPPTDGSREELDATPTPLSSPPPLLPHTNTSREELDSTPTPMVSPPPPPLPPKPSIPPPPDSPPPFSPSPSTSPSLSPSPSPSSSPRHSPPKTIASCRDSSDTECKISEAPTESDFNTNFQHSAVDSWQVSAPEVKSLPLRSSTPGKQCRSSQDEVVVKSTREEHGHKHTTVARHEFRSKTDNRIHITVSSSMDKSRAVRQPSREDLTLQIKDLQIQLREKEEDMERRERQHAKELHQREEQIKKLSKENHKLEREKWELLKRARDAAERSLHLRTQLNMKEGTYRSAQGELDRTKDELLSVKSANTSLRALLSDLRAPRASVDVGIQVEISGPLRRNRSMELAFAQGELSQEQEDGFERFVPYRHSTSTLGDAWPDRRSSRAVSVASIDSSTFDPDSRGTTPISHPMTPPISHPMTPQPSRSVPSTPQPEEKSRKERKKKAPLFGRLRRSAGKGGSVNNVGLDLSQSSIIQGARGPTPISFPYCAVPADLQEHWKVLEEYKSVPFSQWNVKALVAWMESGIGMSQYTATVRERVTSGHAMLALTESDMERKLGIGNPLHRRKLRLAIDDHRGPPHACQYPHAGKIDYSWVAFEWANDCGLPHLTEVLASNLVDGRVLNSLSREDLKKYLKIMKKLDQLSFLCGVELLRMHEFNREAIQDHRDTSRNPLYWTNRDVYDWLKDIQMQGYANNVLGTGVHGAVLFLERGHFTSEHLASIIHLPSSKTQLRRHLTNKLAHLFSGELEDPSDRSPHRLSHKHASPDRKQDRHRRHSSPQRSIPHQLSQPITGNTFHPLTKSSLSQGPPTPTSPNFHPVTMSPSNPASSHLQPMIPPHTPSSNGGPRSPVAPGFYRTNSQPIVLARPVSTPLTADVIRHSLRESALRSLSSARPESPRMRSVTPTLLGGTTV